MKNKIALLHHFITTHSPDLVVGTWLTPNIDSSDLFPPSFSMTVFHKDRPTGLGKGGGVFIAAKGASDFLCESLSVKHWPDLDADCEIIWVQ